MNGIIIKGVGGFYYVKTDEGVIESRARGVFREENLTPLVGDKVSIRISEEDGSGYVDEIFERSSQLSRPPVANVTQAIMVMSIKNPDINTWLLDKFLVVGDHECLDLLICINKADLDKERALELKDVYEKAGYRVIVTSNVLGEGIEDLRKALKDNITVFAGPSGSGKSSLLNNVDPRLELKTGDVSGKTKRGKHTTRHVEIFELDKDSYVLDTPGFSSLNLDFIEDEAELKNFFAEIRRYGEECRFTSCLHDKEPGCMVKEYVSQGIINKDRYDNYLLLLDEVKKIRRY